MPEQEENVFTKFNNWLKRSVTIRLLSITFLVLILMIPKSMIKDLINEREWTRNSAVTEVSSKWGESQTITGPIVTVPYLRYFKTDSGKVVKTTEYAHFLPETLHVQGEVLPERRHRGIYEIVVYNSNLKISGNFFSPDFSEWNISRNNILWDDAFISLGIPDMRGIQDPVNVQWNDGSFPFNPGIETTDVISSGMSVRVPVRQPDSARINYRFSLDLNLNGSGDLNFVPLGRETTVQLTSNWSNPSFDGNFLPDTNNVTDDGFEAEWKVLHLNRNYPQQWRGAAHHTYDSQFGVRLLLPVDQYQKSTRTAKYAIMIIALTFLIFFFIEIMNAKRIHPIQYILVGLALCIFYALLLSLSEHISFNLAYIAAGVAVIGLITVYAQSMFKSIKLTAVLSGVLVILYGFVFTLLQLQDYALLMGSIGLFIVLAAVMWLSRKIDWYSIASRK